MADDADLALAHLQARCLVDGVASVKVRDGEVFMFSRAKVQELLDRMDESKKDTIIVMVKTGKVISKESMQ